MPAPFSYSAARMEKDRPMNASIKHDSPEPPSERRRDAALAVTQELAKPSSLDDVDRRILDVLGRNARTSAREIARQIGMSVGAVLERIQRLERDEIILGYRVEVSPEAVGYGVVATVGIRVHGQMKPRDVMAYLMEMPEVQVAHWVTGPYDVFVTVCAATLSSLQQLLLEKLRQTPGYVHSESMVSLMHWRRVGGQFAYIWTTSDAAR